LKTRFLEYHLPVLLWLVVTFVFSTDAFSSSETSQFIVPALAYFFPTLSTEQVDFWHLAIRKLGHITEYFILAFLAYRCLRHEHGDGIEVKVRTIGFVVLAAMLDEWHQTFTAFRGPSIVDVGYDCFGAVWALWLITTYETWRLRSHSIL
jgi:VanZ family protein